MATEALRDAIARPLPLPPNPVHRFYVGGRATRRFRGLPDRADDSWSEDWVGSCTTASNPSPAGERQGLSSIALPGFPPVLLAELVERYPDEMLGEEFATRMGPTTGLLVKLLSPADAVPVHAHPRPEWARQHLGSRFGKTEAWVFLGTDPPGSRGEAGVGFVPGVDRRGFRAAVIDRDRGLLRDSLRSFRVEEGDVFVAESGTPHCLGGGLSYIELQEPSDDIVVAELHPGDDETFATMGLGWDTALDMIDFPASDAVDGGRDPRQVPTLLSEHGRSTVVSLLNEDYWHLFNATSFDVAPGDDVHVSDGRFSILVVTAGSGEIIGRFGAVPVTAGMTLAVPAFVDVRFRSRDTGLRVVRCLGPDTARIGDRAAEDG